MVVRGRDDEAGRFEMDGMSGDGYKQDSNCMRNIESNRIDGAAFGIEICTSICLEKEFWEFFSVSTMHDTKIVQQGINFVPKAGIQCIINMLPLSIYRLD